MFTLQQHHGFSAQHTLQAEQLIRNLRHELHPDLQDASYKQSSDTQSLRTHPSYTQKAATTVAQSSRGRAAVSCLQATMYRYVELGTSEACQWANSC